MRNELARLTYSGHWKDVFALLAQEPDLVNAASTGKGYTPLHQAAWHGASISVIGKLLAFGADRRISTNEGQSAWDIVESRHPGREDLLYILAPATRSLAQLLRKLIAETPSLFSDYDGNHLICDRIIASLSDTWGRPGTPPRDTSQAPDLGVDERLDAALRAVTGLALSQHDTAQFTPAKGYCFSATTDFVHRALLPPLKELATRAAVIPLEPHWAVLADLFDPAPDEWGLRGDLFLWMELRQALANCELSDTLHREIDLTIQDRLVAAATGLVGTEFGGRRNIYVQRYARGGMSSGMVSSEYWLQTIIPCIVRRTGWLRQSWTMIV